MQWFGLAQVRGQFFLIASGCVLVALLAFAMRHVAAGRFVYAVGANPEAARLAGLRPRVVTFWTFTAMGALVGLAAIANLVQAPQVDPKSGTGLELATIAATVIGGVAISGGRGTLWGVAAGVMLLATINPALTYLHVEAYWSKAIQGSVILLAIVTDGLRNRARSA
jgi:rhamnose transport system permease protein